MFKVTTRNSNPKVKRKELREAAIFMSSLLIDQKLLDNVTLVIESRKFKRSVEAILNPLDFDNFEVYINTLYSRKRQLSSLAHELVHMKQIVCRELGETKDRRTKWKKRFIDEAQISYWDQPWEIEARGREYGLYRRWEQHLQS